MRRKIFRICIIVLLSLFMLSYTKVKAECSTEEKDKLAELANNIKFNYELNNASSSSKKTFTVTMSNLLEGIYAEYTPFIYRYEKDSVSPGVETLDGDFEDNKSYKVNFYGDSSSCKDEFLITKTIDIPKYNTYSEREECKGIEDFKLCNMWYEGSISSEKYFKEEVEKYKKSLSKAVKKKETEKKESLLVKLKNIYFNNIYLSIVLTILVLIIIIVIIIKIRKKRKKRIRIEF